MSRPTAMNRVPSPQDTMTVDRPQPATAESAMSNLPATVHPKPSGQPPEIMRAVSPVFPITGVAKIAGAISAVMSEIGIVVKDGRNEFHRYNYAKMEDVLQKLTPLIAKNGIAIIQTELDRSMFDEDRAIAVRYAFTIFHSSGEVWPERPIQTGVSRCRDSKNNFDDKALNKAHTAARKYFLLALFQIPTGDEDDADKGGNDGGVQRTVARQAPVPSSTGKQPPHAIPTDGEKVQTWTPKFLAHIVNAASHDDLLAWEKLNAAALDLVYDKAPLLYDTILKTFDKRKGELGNQATQKPAGEPWVPPAPERGVVKKPPVAPAAGEIPNAGSNPEEFLKWADAQMAAVTDPHSLETVYNEIIEPESSGIMPPDREELLGMYRKHEVRLSD